MGTQGVGLNKGSTASRNIFYTIRGISLSKTGDNYKHGLVLASRSQGLKLESTIKSMPNSSKVVYFGTGLILAYVAMIANLATSFICSTNVTTLYFILR